MRNINEVIDNNPVLNSELLTLCQWCANYYHYPLGDICQLALPTLMRKPVAIPQEKISKWHIIEINPTNQEAFKRAPKQQEALSLFNKFKAINKEQLKEYKISTATLKALCEKGLIEKRTSTASFSALVQASPILKEEPLTLNEEQNQALKSIIYNKFNTYLLDGVTGSGKTEVYLQAIHKVLAQNKQVLILVPEIGLTPQTVSRFKQRFNVPIATVHSNLSDKQRFNIWQSIRHDQYPIVIGTRSSIFSPLNNLGLIVVDEEHDTSYKQQEGVRYNARDIAVVRAHKLDIPLILGSATPALETLHNAIEARYQHLTLRKRATNQTLPTIKCVETAKHGLAEEAITAIRETIKKQQQVLVFINRRGFSPTLICQDCKWISQCDQCDNPMTLHKYQTNLSRKEYLHCHRCDHRTPTPKHCPNCHSSYLHALGTGTQREEQELEKLFCDTPILRIDRDSTTRKGSLDSMFKQINTGEPCIIIGTQMLAKGHHFANLGLGIILGLDQSFFSSDFRGPERMGQLLTQVSGRIGRENKGASNIAQVIIQTQFTDHPLLQQLLAQNYHSFARTLLSERQLTAMPPYEFITIIRCHAQSPAIAEQFLRQARRQAEDTIAPSPSLQYLGPIPAAIAKRNNRYHFLLQIKTSSRNQRQLLLQHLCRYLESSKQPHGLHWLVDVDPLEF